ncbi:MAG: Cyanophage [Pseudomonadota bacterium]|jgi:hypothetical protein
MAQQLKNLFRQKPWIEYQGDIYRRQAKQGYCGVCGKKTNYKSAFAVEYCCSEECSREMWYDIFVKLMTDRKKKVNS